MQTVADAHMTCATHSQRQVLQCSLPTERTNFGTRSDSCPSCVSNSIPLWGPGVAPPFRPSVPLCDGGRFFAKTQSAFLWCDGRHWRQQCGYREVSGIMTGDTES